MPRKKQAMALLVALTVGGASAAIAQDYNAEQYFKGRTIRFIVSWAAGGTGNSYVRLLVRHFPRHIPGNPSFVVENMPGGGHNIATNYMFSLAEPTGYVMGTYGGARAVASARRDPGVRFDASKLRYIGSVAGFGAVCLATQSSRFRSHKDLAGSAEQWVVGDVAAEGAGPTAINLIAKALGWNARAVTGYKSDSEVNLAQQRGEVTGSCGPFNGFGADPAWATKFRPLFTVGLKRDPNLQDVPTVFELGALPPAEHKALEAYTLRFESSVPLYLPPATGDNIVATLRRAFDQLLADADYREQSARSGLTLDGALPGAEVERSVQRIHDVPAAAWDVLSKAQGQGQGQK